LDDISVVDTMCATSSDTRSLDQANKSQIDVGIWRFKHAGSHWLMIDSQELVAKIKVSFSVQFARKRQV
jgi:hypothetical protein